MTFLLNLLFKKKFGDGDNFSSSGDKIWGWGWDRVE